MMKRKGTQGPSLSSKGKSLPLQLSDTPAVVAAESPRTARKLRGSQTQGQLQPSHHSRPTPLLKSLRAVAPLATSAWGCMTEASVLRSCTVLWPGWCKPICHPGATCYVLQVSEFTEVAHSVNTVDSPITGTHEERSVPDTCK